MNGLSWLETNKQMIDEYEKKKKKKQFQKHLTH